MSEEIYIAILSSKPAKNIFLFDFRALRGENAWTGKCRIRLLESPTGHEKKNPRQNDGD